MIRGCFWACAVLGLIVGAVAIGVPPLWLVGLLASPLAFVAGHWLGWRRAADLIEAGGHKKAATDGESLRRGWRLL